MEFAATDPQRIELALKLSKETEINGDMGEKLDSKNLLLDDVKITLSEVCHLCGKILPATSKVNGGTDQSYQKYSEHSNICDNCMTSVEKSVDFEDSANKRDSGFHTLKRAESESVMDTGQQTESALSSASSADSAVSMGANITEKADSERELLSRAIDNDCVKTQDEKQKQTIGYELNESISRSGDDILSGSVRHAVKESSKDLAKKLFKLDGYKRTEVARILGKNTDYHRQVGKEYLKFFDFSEHSLTDAYREFLTHFALLGETQERERVLSYFSERYVFCNLDFLDKNSDSVHTLVCALTLLNTDLHGVVGLSSGRKKMTCKQFVANLSGLMPDGSDYPKDLLIAVYASVKKHPLPWGGKDQRKVPSRSSSMRQDKEPKTGRVPTKIVNRSLSTRLPFKSGRTAVDPSRAGLGRSAKLKPLSENHGLLWRKAYLDSDGKKVSLGKRGWKVFSVSLQNLELHIIKKGSNEARAISIHHCLAEETTIDSKRQHVFRLTLADSSVTLYQASSGKEAKKWIQNINKAAALLSAAPLCSPVGSQMVFLKALLPSAPSTLPPVNQLYKMRELLKEHEEDAAKTLELSEAEESPSEQTAQYFRDKIAHLKNEIKKYQRYVKILQVHLRVQASRSNSSDEPSSNLETTENGSLVSVTPSEPPLASPSALDDGSESFSLLSSGNGSKFDENSVLSPPTHLVSPHYRPLTLSPTSSLPNLSPILETPTRSHFVNAQAVASLRRRRGREMYESSLNYGEIPPANTNNSNWITTPPSSNAVSEPPFDVDATTCSQQTRCKFGIQTTIIGVQNLPGNQDPFPVKRYEMRIAEMSPDGLPTTETRGLQDSRSRLTGQSSELAEELVRPRHSPSKENACHSRVKGRQEKKGIERYSYMQAVSPFEGNF